MNKQALRQGSIAILAVAVLVIAVLCFTGYLALKTHRTKSATSSTSTTSTTKSSTPSAPAAPTDPYAGWNTYTVPENNAVTFRYPPDWTKDTDYHDVHDSATTPYTRTVRVVSPTEYNGANFAFHLYYKPNATSFAKDCSPTLGNATIIKKTIVPVTLNGKALTINTTTFFLDSLGGPGTTMTLMDGSKCYVAASSGYIQVYGGLGTQSAEIINANTWAARPESATLSTIFKSIKFN